jgi:predicted PurR-regulated permease PerM
MQSPFTFLGILFVLAVVFFITTMYFLIQKDKKEKHLQIALSQKKLEALKASEDFNAQFKSIHQVRRKFKALKR